MKPLLSIALVCGLAGVAFADQQPQLLDGPESGFAIDAEWKASRTWSPRATLPVYMPGASSRDELVVTHLHGEEVRGGPQRCTAEGVNDDVITFRCPALEAQSTQELGAHAMALSYRRQGEADAKEFVTVFYAVTRLQRE